MNCFLLLFVMTNAPIHFTVPPPETTFKVPTASVTFTVATTFTVSEPPMDFSEYTLTTVAEAVRRDVPLYVFVNRATEPVDGAMICTATYYRGSSEPAVIRLYPKDGKLWERMLPPPQQLPPMMRHGPMFFGARDCGPSG